MKRWDGGEIGEQGAGNLASRQRGSLERSGPERELREQGARVHSRQGKGGALSGVGRRGIRSARGADRSLRAPKDVSVSDDL